MAATPLHIAIVGYGTAGQALALLLARDGHRVEVFEQAERPGPIGAGVLVQPTGLSVLWDMGLLDAALAHGRRIDRLHGDNPRGRRVMDMRYADLDTRLYGLAMQRGALFAILAGADGMPETLHAGCRITAIEDDDRWLRDARGQRHGPFDLVAAADGAQSCLRARLGPPRLDRPYPWGALWCLVPEADWPFPNELRQRYRLANRMIGMLPVGTRPGDATPKVSFFWSLPSASTAAGTREAMAAWREEVGTLWPELVPYVADLVEPLQLARAAYRDSLPARWHHGRVVLAGDAAHAMSPQLGQGVNMALLDALALRDALRAQDDVGAALAAYADVRRRHVAIYHRWSRWLTPLFQSERGLAARLRDLAFLPMGRLPPGRTQMLRVLSGTQHGFFGQLRLADAFLQVLAGARGG